MSLDSSFLVCNTDAEVGLTVTYLFLDAVFVLFATLLGLHLEMYM